MPMAVTQQQILRFQSPYFVAQQICLSNCQKNCQTTMASGDTDGDISSALLIVSTLSIRGIRRMLESIREIHGHASGSVTEREIGEE